MKAIILARVSTEEQREMGNSLPAQVERVKNYCERKKYEVDDIYSFDESAYKDKRDEFDKALSYLNGKTEVIAVCFDKVDRLSRNVFDKRVPLLYEMAMRDDIELHFSSENLVINSHVSAAEKFQFGMSLGLAKYYSDAISDNTKRTLQHKRESGQWTSAAPFGYANVALNEEKRLRKDIIIHPINGPYVTAMYEKYVSGNFSCKGLVAWLKAENVKTNKGKEFTTSSVNHILKNPFYYGVMRSKYGMNDHNYPPLITKDLFKRAQDMLSQKNQNPNKSIGINEYIFRGVKCANCGCSYSPERKVNKSGNEYIYYSCTNAKGICKREYVNENKLLKPIYKVLGEMKLTDAQIQRIVNHLKKSHEHESVYHKRQITSLRGAYDAIQLKVDKLLELLIESRIDQNTYDRKLEAYKTKQHDINVQLKDLTTADENYHVTAKTVLSLAQRAEEIFASSEVVEKRQLLKYLLQNTVVNGKTLEFTLRSPFDIISNSQYIALLRGLHGVRTCVIS